MDNEEKKEMGKVLNTTQHPASLEQKEAGVIDLPEEKREKLSKLLTFESLPSKEEIQNRAKQISNLVLEEVACSSCSHKGALPASIGYGVECGNCGMDMPIQAMIGGAPFFMASLQKELLKVGVTPVYAFSIRKSVEKIVDGETKKISVFKHLGFVETVS